MKRIIACIGLLAILLTVSGCGEKVYDEVYTGINTGTTCGNITMGNGSFTYSNGFIYYSDYVNLYEYDTESGKTVTLKLEGNMVIPKSLFVSGDCLYYAQSGVKYITKDGKKEGVLFERPDGCFQFFADGMDAYYLNGQAGSFFYRDMETGEEHELATDVLVYYVDDKNVYYASITNDSPLTTGLFQADRDTLEFKQVELSFDPITVYVCSEGMFLARMGTYQLVQYANGIERELPMRTLYYQVHNGCLIYVDADGFSDSYPPVKSYDLKTGETTVLCENVYNFSILEDRYACFKCMSNDFSFCMMDMETGETVQMPTAAT